MSYQKFCSPRCYRRFTGETEPERIVRLALIELGIAFHQEHAVPGWRYPVDFFLPALNTALEVDEPYWHNTAKGRRQDERKTLFLQSRGYRVLRLVATPFYGALTESMIAYLSAAIGIAEHGVPQSDISGLYPIQLSLPLH